MEQVGFPATILWGFAPEANTAPRAAEPAAPAQSQHTRQANAAMTRYAAGDDRAFEDLYRLLAPRLYRLCMFLSGRNDAEELVQEVFLKMHRARATFVSDGSVVAWSFAIARTTYLDRVRQRKRRPEAALEQSQLESRATSASTPEDVSAQRSLEGALERELGKLSESLRSAYVLVKLEELSCAEAGEVLGVSVSAVKQRVHRASEVLKASLGEVGW